MFIASNVKETPSIIAIINSSDKMCTWCRYSDCSPHVQPRSSVDQANNPETIGAITSKMKAGLRSVSVLGALSSLHFSTATPNWL